jgi:biotin operon repressor
MDQSELQVPIKYDPRSLASLSRTDRPTSDTRRSEMPFERSLGIERRLREIVRLIARERFSTPMLAEKLGVSIPTISRCVTALRVRGYDIRAQKQEGGWGYVLAPPRKAAARIAGKRRAARRNDPVESS